MPSNADLVPGLIDGSHTLELDCGAVLEVLLGQSVAKLESGDAGEMGDGSHLAVCTWPVCAWVQFWTGRASTWLGGTWTGTSPNSCPPLTCTWLMYQDILAGGMLPATRQARFTSSPLWYLAGSIGVR